MKDVRIEKLAKNLLNYSVRLKKGEHILIEILGEDAIVLGKELIKQAENIGAYPYFNIVNYEILREMLMNAKEEQIKMYAKHDSQRMKDMDVYIGIRASTNTAELIGVPPEKMDLYNKYYTVQVHFNERVKNTKWCILRYPNSSMAQMSNMSTEEFEDFYFKVCTLDYAKMSKEMDNLVSLMNKTKNVHIVGPDTDLRFSIEGIPAEKYMGTFNIPDGEVATAPVKTSVNGYITYNTETRYNGVLFNNVKFEFKDGKIVNATSNKTKEMNKILDTDEGARYIGEFAECGADLITLHAESTKHLHRAIQQVKAAGCKVGVSLNPATPLSALDYILDEIDMVLIMTVNPGFGGQKYISYCDEKIRALRAMIDERGLDVRIEIDGGVKASNIKRLADCGVDIFVAGSAVFEGDITANMKEIMEQLD